MNRISILIVEDELKLLEAYTKYISLFCEFIYTASDGEEALKLYYEHQPNIILTDINMLNFNGMQFIQKIREVDNTTKIIILSAHTETENLLKAVQLNLVSYLVKPVKMSELKLNILQAIEEVSQKNLIYLNHHYTWNYESNYLKYKNIVIHLTRYENLFIKCLVNTINHNISYEELHNYIYINEEFSLSAISSLVKRIRKKTTKEFIKSSFKFGYRIESI